MNGTGNPRLHATYYFGIRTEFRVKSDILSTWTSPRPNYGMIAPYRQTLELFPQFQAVKRKSEFQFKNILESLTVHKKIRTRITILCNVVDDECEEACDVVRLQTVGIESLWWTDCWPSPADISLVRLRSEKNGTIDIYS